jgi:hypothetical protein
MSNNKQQTAVEWFIEELEENGKAYEENQVVRTINICIDVSDYMELKQQAKEMEKERMIGFTNKYINSELWVNCNAIESDSTVEQYYEQTYGGGEQ